MIGHYLLTLHADQEGRVLTGRMLPEHLVDPDGNRCLLGTAEDWVYDADGNDIPQLRRWQLVSWPKCDQPLGHRHRFSHWGVGHAYDTLCARFGFQRVNAAIRNRILSNRANRVLRHAPQLEAV